MSDLPTRSKALIRGSKPHGLSSNDWVAGPVLRMYGNGDLLTREEAANDPEVRRMVNEHEAEYRQWQRQNEAPTVYSVVTDDEAFAVKWRVKGEYRRPPASIRDEFLHEEWMIALEVTDDE